MRLTTLAACLALSSASFAQLPAEPSAIAGPPWKIIFDGKNLQGLRGVQKADFLKAGWKIIDGSLVLTKSVKDSGKQTGGDLATLEAFLDFEFSFEWKNPVSGNSGILYFNRAGLGQRPSGHEFQIIDDVRHPDGLKGGPPRRTGSLYAILPPNAPPDLRDGDWNEGRIVVQGEMVQHWINGANVLEYRLGQDLAKTAASAGVKVPLGFGSKVKSPVLILDQGEEISYRNIRFRPLPPKL
jgi:hypothetical protein